LDTSPSLGAELVFIPVYVEAPVPNLASLYQEVGDAIAIAAAIGYLYSPWIVKMAKFDLSNLGMGIKGLAQRHFPWLASRGLHWQYER
jgi:hypothetical protein